MNTIEIRRFAGINNLDALERLVGVPSRDVPAVDLADAVNVDLDDSGRISRRAGQTLMLGGPAHSLWSNGDLCLFVQDGMMFRLYPDMSTEPVAAGLSDSPLAYAQVNNRIYHADGEFAAVFDEGRVRSWGIPLSLTDVAASITGGTLPAGVYQFAMTVLRADGQESGCGLAARLDLPDGAGITFSWTPPRDPELTQVALYLTQPDGQTLMQAAIVDAGLGAFTYVGGERSLPLATQWLDAPPPASVLALYRGRLYLAVGAFLYATAPLSYEHCDLRDFRAFDGSAIRVLCPVEGGLFVATDSATYFLSGASFADNALVKKLDAGGIRGSAITADGSIVTGRTELAGQVVALFATTEGIVLGLPDGSLQHLTRERFAYTARGEGAALFRATGATQYLLALPT